MNIQCLHLIRHFFRRIFWPMLVYFIAFLVAPLVKASPAPVTLTWSYWGDPWEVAINQKMIAVYEAEHPDVHIVSRHAPYWDYANAVQTWREKNNLPDILFLSHIHQYVEKDDLVPLNEFIEKDHYTVDDFYPQLLQLFTENGKIYGFPRDNDTQVIFYNKRHFRHKNIAFPACGWSWADLLSTARQLTDKRQGQYGFALQEDAIEELYLQNGGDKYDVDGNVEGLFFGAPEGQSTLKRFIQIQQEVAPPHAMQHSEEIADAFIHEKVSMILGNHALISTIDNEIAWGVTCLPSGKKRMNRLGGAGYAMSKTTRNKQAAWEFLSWLSGPTAQAMFAESGSIFPARMSVSHSDFYRRILGHSNADVFLEEMRYATHHGTFDERPALTRMVSSFLESVLEKKIPFDTAIERLCTHQKLHCTAPAAVHQ